MWSERKWAITADPNLLSQSNSRFRILSFNVLAASLVTPAIYRDNPPHIMNWRIRRHVIIQEILRHNAEILTLQEIDWNCFPFFREELGVRGYEGVYRQKSCGKCDGLATFWKKNRFQLLESYGHVLLEHRSMERGQVALFTVLRDLKFDANGAMKRNASPLRVNEPLAGTVNPPQPNLLQSTASAGRNITSLSCDTKHESVEMLDENESVEMLDENESVEMLDESESVEMLDESENVQQCGKCAHVKDSKRVEYSRTFADAEVADFLENSSSYGGESIIIVVNLHLLFNTKRGDIKLAQLCDTFNHTWSLFERYGTTRYVEIVPETPHAEHHRLQEANRSATTDSHVSDTSAVAKDSDPNSNSSTCLEDAFHDGGRISDNLCNSSPPGTPSLSVIFDPPAVLLCGDFNFCPQSSLYHWLRQGSLEFGSWPHHSSSSLSGQYLLTERKYERNALGHNGCGSTIPAFIVPPVTGETAMYKGWIRDVLDSVDTTLMSHTDYWWTSPKNLIVGSTAGSSESDQCRSIILDVSEENVNPQTAESDEIASSPANPQVDPTPPASLLIDTTTGDDKNDKMVFKTSDLSASQLVKSVFQLEGDDLISQSLLPPNRAFPGQRPHRTISSSFTDVCNNHEIGPTQQSPNNFPRPPYTNYATQCNWFPQVGPVILTRSPATPPLPPIRPPPANLVPGSLLNTPLPFSSAYCTSDQQNSKFGRSADPLWTPNRHEKYKFPAAEPQGVEAAFTSWHSWQKGCIDYIWYSVNELSLLALLEMPYLFETSTCGSIPNRQWPSSDHFSLVSDFVRKPKTGVGVVFSLRYHPTTKDAQPPPPSSFPLGPQVTSNSASDLKLTCSDKLLPLKSRHIHLLCRLSALHSAQTRNELLTHAIHESPVMVAPQNLAVQSRWTTGLTR